MTSWSLWLARKRGFWPHEVNNSQSLGLSQSEAALGERGELVLAWPHHQNCFIHPIALSTDNDILYSKVVKGLLFEIQEIRIDSIDSPCLRLQTRSLQIFLTFCVNPLSRVETDSLRDCNSRSLLSNCPPPASLVVNPPHPDCDNVFSDPDFDVVWTSASSAT